MSNSAPLALGRHFTLPVIGALVMHLVIGALLLGSWSLSHKKTSEFKIPENIKAELVSYQPPKLEAPKAVAKPQPVAKPKPVTPPKPKPKPAETKPKPTETKPKPAPKDDAINLNAKPVEDKPAPEPEPALNEEDLFADLLQGLAAEEEAIEQQIANIAQQQERDAEIQEQVTTYSQLIKTQVEQVWSRPVELRLMDVSNLKAKVFIELLPTGELLEVTLAEPSGHEVYDQSVLRAVERVRRFKVPEDAEVFEAGGFRRIGITFRPEDLMKL